MKYKYLKTTFAIITSLSLFSSTPVFAEYFNENTYLQSKLNSNNPVNNPTLGTTITVDASIIGSNSGTDATYADLAVIAAEFLTGGKPVGDSTNVTLTNSVSTEAESAAKLTTKLGITSADTNWNSTVSKSDAVEAISKAANLSQAASLDLKKTYPSLKNISIADAVKDNPNTLSYTTGTATGASSKAYTGIVGTGWGYELTVGTGVSSKAYTGASSKSYTFTDTGASSTAVTGTDTGASSKAYTGIVGTDWGYGLAAGTGPITIVEGSTTSGGQPSTVGTIVDTVATGSSSPVSGPTSDGQAGNVDTNVDTGNVDNQIIVEGGTNTGSAIVTGQTSNTATGTTNSTGTNTIAGSATVTGQTATGTSDTSNHSSIVKVPKSKIASYKKIFTKANCGRTVSVIHYGSTDTNTNNTGSGATGTGAVDTNTNINTGGVDTNTNTGGTASSLSNTTSGTGDINTGKDTTSGTVDTGGIDTGASSTDYIILGPTGTDIGDFTGTGNVGSTGADNTVTATDSVTGEVKTVPAITGGSTENSGAQSNTSGSSSASTDLSAAQQFINTLSQLSTNLVPDNKYGYDKNRNFVGTDSKDAGYDKDGNYQYGYDNSGNYVGADVIDAGYDKDGFYQYGYSNGVYYGAGQAFYDKNGYDRNGKYQYGYDKNGKYVGKDSPDSGYDFNRIDRDGYQDGYDINGYDRNGYDKNGYDKNGFDKNGIDKNGNYQYGYDGVGNYKGKDDGGFDKDGYDKDGIDKDGNYQYGYDINGKYVGKDKTGSGYDKNGYGTNGYNKDGIDKDGKYQYGYDQNHNYVGKNGGYTYDGYDRDGKLFSTNGISFGKVNGANTGNGTNTGNGNISLSDLSSLTLKAATLENKSGSTWIEDNLGAKKITGIVESVSNDNSAFKNDIGKIVTVFTSTDTNGNLTLIDGLPVQYTGSDGNLTFSSQEAATTTTSKVSDWYTQSFIQKANTADTTFDNPQLTALYENNAGTLDENVKPSANADSKGNYFVVTYPTSGSEYFHAGAVKVVHLKNYTTKDTDGNFIYIGSGNTVFKLAADNTVSAYNIDSYGFDLTGKTTIDADLYFTNDGKKLIGYSPLGSDELNSSYVSSTEMQYDNNRDIASDDNTASVFDFDLAYVNNVITITSSSDMYYKDTNGNLVKLSPSVLTDTTSYAISPLVVTNGAMAYYSGNTLEIYAQVDLVGTSISVTLYDSAGNSVTKSITVKDTSSTT